MRICFRALALAFNCTLNRLPLGVRLEQFTYDNQMMADILFECVKNTLFKGVSVSMLIFYSFTSRQSVPSAALTTY